MTTIVARATSAGVEASAILESLTSELVGTITQNIVDNTLDVPASVTLETRTTLMEMFGLAVRTEYSAPLERTKVGGRYANLIDVGFSGHVLSAYRSIFSQLHLLKELRQRMIVNCRYKNVLIVAPSYEFLVSTLLALWSDVCEFEVTVLFPVETLDVGRYMNCPSILSNLGSAILAQYSGTIDVVIRQTPTPDAQNFENVSVPITIRPLTHQAFIKRYPDECFDFVIGSQVVYYLGRNWFSHHIKNNAMCIGMMTFNLYLPIIHAIEEKKVTGFISEMFASHFDDYQGCMVAISPNGKVAMMETDKLRLDKVYDHSLDQFEELSNGCATDGSYVITSNGVESSATSLGIYEINVNSSLTTGGSVRRFYWFVPTYAMGHSNRTKKYLETCVDEHLFNEFSAFIMAIRSSAGPLTEQELADAQTSGVVRGTLYKFADTRGLKAIIKGSNTLLLERMVPLIVDNQKRRARRDLIAAAKTKKQESLCCVGYCPNCNSIMDTLSCGMTVYHDFRRCSLVDRAAHQAAKLEFHILDPDHEGHGFVFKSNSLHRRDREFRLSEMRTPALGLQILVDENGCADVADGTCWKSVYRTLAGKEVDFAYHDFERQLWNNTTCDYAVVTNAKVLSGRCSSFSNLKYVVEIDVMSNPRHCRLLCGNYFRLESWYKKPATVVDPHPKMEDGAPIKRAIKYAKKVYKYLRSSDKRIDREEMLAINEGKTRIMGIINKTKSVGEAVNCHNFGAVASNSGNPDKRNNTPKAAGTVRTIASKEVESSNDYGMSNKGILRAKTKVTKTEIEMDALAAHDDDCSALLSPGHTEEEECNGPVQPTFGHNASLQESKPSDPVREKVNNVPCEFVPKAEEANVIIMQSGTGKSYLAQRDPTFSDFKATAFGKRFWAIVEEKYGKQWWRGESSESARKQVDFVLHHVAYASRRLVKPDSYAISQVLEIHSKVCDELCELSICDGEVLLLPLFEGASNCYPVVWIPDSDRKENLKERQLWQSHLVDFKAGPEVFTPIEEFPWGGNYLVTSVLALSRFSIVNQDAKSNANACSTVCDEKASGPAFSEIACEIVECAGAGEPKDVRNVDDWQIFDPPRDGLCGYNIIAPLIYDSKVEPLRAAIKNLGNEMYKLLSPQFDGCPEQTNEEVFAHVSNDQMTEVQLIILSKTYKFNFIIFTEFEGRVDETGRSHIEGLPCLTLVRMASTSGGYGEGHWCSLQRSATPRFEEEFASIETAKALLDQKENCMVLFRKAQDYVAPPITSCEDHDGDIESDDQSTANEISAVAVTVVRRSRVTKFVTPNPEAPKLVARPLQIGFLSGDTIREELPESYSVDSQGRLNCGEDRNLERVGALCQRVRLDCDQNSTITGGNKCKLMEALSIKNFDVRSFHDNALLGVPGCPGPYPHCRLDNIDLSDYFPNAESVGINDATTNSHDGFKKNCVRAAGFIMKVCRIHAGHNCSWSHKGVPCLNAGLPVIVIAGVGDGYSILAALSCLAARKCNLILVDTHNMSTVVLKALGVDVCVEADEEVASENLIEALSNHHQSVWVYRGEIMKFCDRYRNTGFYYYGDLGSDMFDGSSDHETNFLHSVECARMLDAPFSSHKFMPTRGVERWSGPKGTVHFQPFSSHEMTFTMTSNDYGQKMDYDIKSLRLKQESGTFVAANYIISTQSKKVIPGVKASVYFKVMDIRKEHHRCPLDEASIVGCLDGYVQLFNAFGVSWSTEAGDNIDSVIMNVRKRVELDDDFEGQLSGERIEPWIVVGPPGSGKTTTERNLVRASGSTTAAAPRQNLVKTLVSSGMCNVWTHEVAIKKFKPGEDFMLDEFQLLDHDYCDMVCRLPGVRNVFFFGDPGQGKLKTVPEGKIFICRHTYRFGNAHVNLLSKQYPGFKTLVNDSVNDDEELLIKIQDDAEFGQWYKKMTKDCIIKDVPLLSPERMDVFAKECGQMCCTPESCVGVNFNQRHVIRLPDKYVPEYTKIPIWGTTGDTKLNVLFSRGNKSIISMSQNNFDKLKFHYNLSSDKMPSDKQSVVIRPRKYREGPATEPQGRGGFQPGVSGNVSNQRVRVFEPDCAIVINKLEGNVSHHKAMDVVTRGQREASAKFVRAIEAPLGEEVTIVHYSRARIVNNMRIAVTPLSKGQLTGMITYGTELFKRYVRGLQDVGVSMNHHPLSVDYMSVMASQNVLVSERINPNVRASKPITEYNLLGMRASMQRNNAIYTMFTFDYRAQYRNLSREAEPGLESGEQERLAVDTVDSIFANHPVLRNNCRMMVNALDEETKAKTLCHAIAAANIKAAFKTKEKELEDFDALRMDVVSEAEALCNGNSLGPDDILKSYKDPTKVDGLAKTQSKMPSKMKRVIDEMVYDIESAPKGGQTVYSASEGRSKWPLHAAGVFRAGAALINELYGGLFCHAAKSGTNIASAVGDFADLIGDLDVDVYEFDQEHQDSNYCQYILELYIHSIRKVWPALAEATRKILCNDFEGGWKVYVRVAGVKMIIKFANGSGQEVTLDLNTTTQEILVAAMFEVELTSIDDPVTGIPKYSIINKGPKVVASVAVGDDDDVAVKRGSVPHYNLARKIRAPMKVDKTSLKAFTIANHCCSVNGREVRVLTNYPRLLLKSLSKTFLFPKKRSGEPWEKLQAEVLAYQNGIKNLLHELQRIDVGIISECTKHSHSDVAESQRNLLLFVGAEPLSLCNKMKGFQSSPFDEMQ